MRTTKQKTTKASAKEMSVLRAILEGGDLSEISDKDKQSIARELGIDLTIGKVNAPMFSTWVSEKTGKQYFIFTPFDEERGVHVKNSSALWVTVDILNQLNDNMSNFIDYVNDNMQ